MSDPVQPVRKSSFHWFSPGTDIFAMIFPENSTWPSEAGAAERQQRAWGELQGWAARALSGAYPYAAELVDDVVAEFILRLATSDVLEKISRERYDASGYLSRVMRNVAKECLRHRARDWNRPNSPRRTVRREPADPSDLAEERDLVAWVRERVDELSEAQRRAVWREHPIDGLSSEAAKPGRNEAVDRHRGLERVRRAAEEKFGGQYRRGHPRKRRGSVPRSSHSGDAGEIGNTPDGM